MKSLWKKDNLDKIYNFQDDFMKGISVCVSNPKHFFNEFKNIYTNIFKSNKINEHFESPKICVIGSQSSGKSSLLENITKTPLFPKRKQGVGTKSPIRLNLNSCKEKESEFWINGEQVKENEIMSKIDDIFEQLGDSYNDEAIEVKITNKDLIDFEFYDLPGIVSYPEDKRDFTEKLTEKYIIQDNNIILCVIPITINDLSTYFPISLIKKHKREKNTILVFTMADKVQKEDIGEQIISRILNESSEINIEDYLGVNIIINRNENNGVSLENLDINSSKWFQDNIIDVIPDDHPEKPRVIQKLGITNLINSLNIYYKDFIDKNWIPNTMNNINTQINKLCQEEALIGNNFQEEESDFGFSLKLKDIIINIFIPLLVKQYFQLILAKLEGIQYEKFYNFEAYFQSLITELKEVKHIDFKNITTIKNDYYSYYFFSNNGIKNVWRYGRLNNKISFQILKMFREKCLFYLECNKLNILQEVMEQQINGKRNYDKNIIITILKFSEKELVEEKKEDSSNYLKSCFLTKLQSSSLLYKENIYVSIYRYELWKEINDLRMSLNKLNILKYEKDVKSYVKYSFSPDISVHLRMFLTEEKSCELLSMIQKVIQKRMNSNSEMDYNSCLELLDTSKQYIEKINVDNMESETSSEEFNSCKE